MGDTDGASDWATSETNLVDALQDEMEHAGWDGNSAEGGDNQVLRYDYSFGDFGVAVSAVQGDNGAGVVDDVLAVGAKYSADMGGATVGFGVGYQDRGAEDKTSASVSVGVDSLSGVLYYSDDSDVAIGSNVGVGVKYSTGALTVGASWGDYSDQDLSGYAVAVNYDLGGGAVVQAGYANDDDAGVETDKFSLGLAMSF
jgi:outer membrane protein OmpU